MPKDKKPAQKPVETLASVLGGETDPAKQLAAVKALVGEVLYHRQNRQPFVMLVVQPDGKLKVEIGGTDNLDEVVEMLQQGMQTAVEERFRQVEAAKTAPPPA